MEFLPVDDTPSKIKSSAHQRALLEERVVVMSVPETGSPQEEGCLSTAWHANCSDPNPLSGAEAPRHAAG